MKNTTEKKQTIILYILEKMAAEVPSLSKTVAETFNISTNTVHTYLNELIETGVIEKQKRGQYKLIFNVSQNPTVIDPKVSTVFTIKQKFTEEICLQNITPNTTLSQIPL